MDGKIIIGISESLFQKDFLPPDLNNADFFDLRVFKLPTEVIALVAALNPQLLIFDLTDNAFSGLNLTEFIGRLRFSRDMSERVTAVIVVVTPDQQAHAEEFFKAGVTSLLGAPLSKEILWQTIEKILGLRLRRFERKKIQFPVTMKSRQGQTWTGVAKNINLECILIPGNNLPAEGTNVQLKGSETDLTRFDLWVHCWRYFKEVLIVRFLTPSPEFLQAIDQLPLTPMDRLEKTPGIDTGALTLNSLKDPHTFMPFDLDELQAEMAQWISNKTATPKPWTSALGSVPQQVRETFLRSEPEEKMIAKSYAFSIALQHQLKTLQQKRLISSAADARDARSIIAHHETVMVALCDALTAILLQAVESRDTARVEHLNRLKTLLYKHVTSMRQIVARRESLLLDLT